MLHLHYHLITGWLHQHPGWGGLAAFVVAFAESLAIIGSIVPGTVTMTTVGVLIGSGVLPIWITLLWAIMGAFLGDGLSFFIGYYFKSGIRRIWLFSRFPKLFTTGESFFFRHGGKSIFIGRFVGPVRAIVPIIAGTLNMSPKRYFPFSFISAVCWAPVYMLPGILLGTISLEMPADVAAELIILVILLLIVCWLLFWVVKTIYLRTHNYFAIILDRKWRQWLTQPSKHWICVLLRRADRPYSYGQLFSASIMLLAAISFGLIFVSLLLLHGPFHTWNLMFYHLFRSMRAYRLDKIFVIITSFGYFKMLLWVMVALCLWFAIRRHWLELIHCALGEFLVLSSIFIMKHIYHSPRPLGLLHNPVTSSFPSGHVTSAIVVYGLIAFFLTRNLAKETRKFFYWGCVLLCLVIAISRLYLGVHWLTDILGAFALGITILTFTIISYRRFRPNRIISWAVGLVVFFALLVSNGWYLYNNYSVQLRNYQCVWRTHTISMQAWWQQRTYIVPSYRMNRFGRPVELLNMQWAGSLVRIRATLENHGWQNLHVDNYFTALTQLLTQASIAKHRPLLEKLYNDQHPVLEMIKYIDPHKPPLVIRLWRANVILTPQHLPLWVGTVSYNVLQKHFLFFYNHPRVIPATEKPHKLIAALATYMWQMKVEAHLRVPAKLLKLYPLSKVILLRPASIY